MTLAHRLCRWNPWLNIIWEISRYLQAIAWLGGYHYVLARQRKYSRNLTPVNNSFFLTPQIANLMEDFVREIRRGSSLFLLYGEEGVGKSRLLRKLVSDRLTEQNVHFIDFDSDTQNNSSEFLKQAAAEASEADIIILDHFDSASNKSQQQIFDSWATDGQDKNLNFIVCANSVGLKRFRQLAQQFQLEAKSFQLRPFDKEVSEVYLQYLLYPEYPFATLVLPVSVKRLLHQSKGYFYRIKEIADQHGALIEIKHEPESESRLIPFAIIIGLVTVIAAAGYFFHSTRSSPATELPIVQSQADSNLTGPEPDSDPEPVPEPDPEPEPRPEPELEPKPVQEPKE